MDTPETDWTCPRTYRHPKFVRSLALQLWGLQCSRNYDCTHAALLARAVEAGLSCVPDVRTLRQWAKDDDWSGEMARMLRSIAPDVMGGMVVDLVMGASEAMPWLRRVLQGTEPSPNGTRLRATLAAISMVGLPRMVNGETTLVMRSLKLPDMADDPEMLPSLTEHGDRTDTGWKERLAARISPAPES